MAKLPGYLNTQVTRQQVQGVQKTTNNNLSNAINSAVGGVTQLAQVQNKMQEREARDYVLNQQNEIKVSLAKQREVLSNTVKSGSEYTDGISKFLNEQKSKALEGAPNEKSSNATSEFYNNLTANEIERSVPVAARMNAQNTARIQKDALQLDINSTVQDPASYDKSLANGTLVIQASDIPESQKDAAIKSFDNELSYYRFKGQISKSPSTALKELKSGKWNGRLESDQLASLTREAKNQIDSVNAANKQKLSSEISEYIAYKSSGGQESRDYSESTIKAVYGSKKGSKIYKDIASANQFASNYAKVELASYDELISIYESEKVTGPENFRTEAPQQSKIEAAIQKRNQELTSDSAEYAMKSPNVRNSYNRFSATGDGVTFAETTISEQRRLGMPDGYESILPKKVAQSMVAAYDAGGENAAALVNNLQDQFGDYYPKVLEELTKSGLSPHASVVAILPQGSRAATLLAQADKDGYKKIASNLEKDDVDSIKEDVASNLVLFNSSTYSESTKSQIRTSAELLGMKYLSSGVYNDASTASEKATDDIVNSRYNFSDDYRIPVNYDQSKVEDGVDNAIDKLNDIKLMPPASNLPPEIAESVYKQRMKAKVQTLNDDSGVVMVDFQNQPILSADGKLIKFTWDDLAK